MENSHLRILHIYKNYAPVVGGIENHIKMLAEGEAARGLRPTVLVANDSTLTDDEQLNGVRIIRTGRLVTVASTPLSIAMAFEGSQLAPDLINLHMPYPPGDIVARTVRGRPALVVTYHSDVVRQQQLLRLYRPILDHTLARADRIIASSAAYVASSPFLRPHADICRVVPYGVDAVRFGTVDTEAIARIRARARGPLVLSVGVLRYYKGLHILLDAMRQVDATLIVVGDGPEGDALREQARAAGIDDRVLFVGRVSDSDLVAYYQAADVFVLASHLRSEAFGIVLLEAMAAGLPLVTTDIGTATSEINVHGWTGFVVPPSDPDALARALRVLLADHDLRAALGNNARQRAVSEYTPTRMIERTVSVYNDALAAHGAALRGDYEHRS